MASTSSELSATERETLIKGLRDLKLGLDQTGLDSALRGNNNGATAKADEDEADEGVGNTGLFGSRFGKSNKDTLNGMSFSENVYVPEEVMEIVLSHCDNGSLVNLSRVCLAWCTLVNRAYFWRHVMKNRNMVNDWAPIYRHVKDHPDAWQVYFSMIKHRFLNRNMVKNPCGEDGFAHWTFMSGELGGWTIDSEANLQQYGIPPVPPSNTNSALFCFGTNNFSCSKEQTIDLWEQGFTPPIMRACVPFAITWSEITSTPESRRGFYEVKAGLLDTDLGQISPYSPYVYNAREILNFGTKWRRREKRFIVDSQNAHEILGELRYFHIFHGAMEEGMTQGHFGPRIAQTSVVVSLIQP